jgi:hypothetical protein
MSLTFLRVFPLTLFLLSELHFHLGEKIYVQKGISYRRQNLKNTRKQSSTFLQLAKGSLIALGAIAKGY